MDNTSPKKPSYIRQTILLLIGLGLLGMLLTLIYTFYTQSNMLEYNVVTQPTKEEVATKAENDIVIRLMRQLEKDPMNFEVLVALAEHLLHGKDWGRAEQFIHRAILINPVAMKPYYMLGIAQHKKGLHEEAVANLEHALTLEDTASIRYNLGVLYAFFLKDTARALEMLKEALKAPEGNPSLTKAIQSVMQQLVEPVQKPSP